jgi:hypothetical protein
MLKPSSRRFADVAGRLRSVAAIMGCVLVLVDAPRSAGQSRDEVREALHRAVQFFRQQASSQGGYVYQWSADLAKREGEGLVGADTAWIQPPGTPAVGMAYLNAYRLCGDPLLLEAAKETAAALLRGQLESGGWDDRIEFDPMLRSKYAYRVDSQPVGNDKSDKRRDITTFDDDKSQSVARFLMQLDAETKFQDAAIHEAITYALDRFVKAQYANGAWPQRYSEFPDASQAPSLQASIDPDWPRVFPDAKYAHFYTLNDNTISDLITTMLDAWEVYDEPKYLDAAVRAGDFLLKAQLPEPQPGWAQQYDANMKPIWARKFEPPAISGSESQGVMRTLIQLYQRAGHVVEQPERFLEPIPGALAYFRRSLLDDGRLARFYEMGTNRPLFCNKQYELTYVPDDLPTHYGFIVDSRLDRIESDLARAQKLRKDQFGSSKSLFTPKRSEVSPEQLRAILEGLDERGAWVEEGRLKNYGSDDPTREILRSETFIKNLNALASWLGKD